MFPRGSRGLVTKTVAQKETQEDRLGVHIRKKNVLETRDAH